MISSKVNFLATFFMLISASISNAESLSDSSSFTVKMKDAFQILFSTVRGKEIYAEAEKNWGIHNDQDLLRYFYEGKVSKTDAVLSRKWDPETGEEIRIREVSISVKTNQSLEGVVLDLAHEMTHALAPASWDPYDAHLTAVKYIQSSLELGGGEVEALMSECRVVLERTDFQRTRARCESYVENGKIIKERVVKDFYRVGNIASDLKKKLGPESALLPFLSEEPARFHSSTGKAPYPVSLYKEYREITELACANSNRRKISMTQSSPQSFSQGGRAQRSPAQDNLSALNQFLDLRCGARF